MALVEQPARCAATTALWNLAVEACAAWCALAAWASARLPSLSGCLGTGGFHLSHPRVGVGA
jgi:hypothetical protein